MTTESDVKIPLTAQHFAKILEAAAPGEWIEIKRASPFITKVGPVMMRNVDGFVELRLDVVRDHTNARGAVHGGMVATFADIALGRNLAMKSKPGRYYVTTSLNVNYLAATTEGDCLIAKIHSVKAGTRVGFVAGQILSNGRAVAEISGTFCAIETTETRDLDTP